MKTITMPATKTYPAPGVWNSEPRKKQWQDPATGLPCLIVRQDLHGGLCGYVGVPANTKAPERGEEDFSFINEWECHFDVHGGITYGPEPCQENKDHICHLVEEGEDDNVVWLGFDCAHSGDYTPGSTYHMGRGPTEWETYKDFAYVTKEVTNFAKQLKAHIDQESLKLTRQPEGVSVLGAGQGS